MARYFGIPFAVLGDKIVVPDATQPDGSVSFSQGFGFDYERENTDPSYKPVPREQTNSLYHDITEAIGVIQKQGSADWTTDAQPYEINAIIRYDNKLWRSLVTSNNATPSEGASWTQIGAYASDVLAGVIQIATAAEARAFVAGKAIDGQRLADAFTGSNVQIGSSGFQKLPGPTPGALHIMWGTTATAPQGGSVPVTFPIAFPTSVLKIVVSPLTTGNNTNSYSVGVNSGTQTGFVLTNNSGTSGVATASYIAIGN